MLTDNEIKNVTEDSLKFNALSETLQEIIISSDTPLTIGLYGEWGSGKTSLMRMTQDLLKNNDSINNKKIKTAWFDAWKFDKSHDLRVALIQSILREMEEDNDVEDSIKKKINDLRERVNWRGLGIATMNQFLPRPMVFKEGSEPLIEEKEDISNTLELIGDFEEEFMEITKEYVGDNDGKLVVFIDDLDRCIPKNSIEILEAIKLFLNVKYSVFIIGADKKVIESGIHHKYQMYEDWGKKYLDKIIQIPFFLPPLREEIIISEFIPKLPIDDEIKQYKEIIAEVGLNPRTIKRLINQFELQNILADKQGIKIDKKIMAKLSVIQFRKPEFHDTLVEMYVESQTNLIEIIKKVHEASESEKMQLEEWESLEKYFYDKKFIKFLFEEPLLEKINLDDYVYLVRSTTSFEDEKIDNISVGFSFAEKNEYNKAIKSYDKALKLNPDDFYAWYYKGNAFYKLNQYNEAIKCFNKASELNPDYLYAWYYKGNTLINLKEYEEAIKCYNKALELDPDYLYAWYYKGYAFYKLNQYEKAIKYYNTALKLNPDYLYAWFYKGNALINLKEYEEAIKCYSTALELNPDYVYAWYYKGNAFYKLNHYEEAIKCYNKALELDPDCAYAWYYKGNAFYNLKKYEIALKYYNKVLELNPDVIDDWYIVGNTFKEMGKYKLATEYYNKAIQLNPKDIQSWYNLGNAYMDLKQFNLAIGCYDKVLKLDPKLTSAWNKKGSALKNLGRLEEAEIAYKKSINQ